MLPIRVATPEDAPAIAHVHVASWRTTYAGLMPDTYLAALDEGERITQWQHWLTLDVVVLVAELDGEIVGFAGAGPIRESLGGYDAELYTLYLLDHAQRQGIGTRLLTALAGALRARGFESMLAWVLAGNNSRDFYERTGAVLLAEKQVEIGGAPLPVLAFGWRNLDCFQNI